MTLQLNDSHRFFFFFKESSAKDTFNCSLLIPNAFIPKEYINIGVLQVIHDDALTVRSVLFCGRDSSSPFDINAFKGDL